MSRSRLLAVISSVFAIALSASPAADSPNPSLWNEYGLVRTTSGTHAKLAFVAYRFKDLTGALAAWESMRSPQSQSCKLAPLCTSEGSRTIVSDDNYLLVFDSAKIRPLDIAAVIAGLPDRRDTSLPALLTFLPRDGLVPGSTRYILGNVSLVAFAPELASAQPGLEQGAEAETAAYRLPGAFAPVRLALFYYPTPELARLHSVSFKLLPNVFAKRSAVLIAVVYGGASQAQADTLLSRVEYEAKITWNDIPPPSPIKPLYQLLVNIAYMSGLLILLCTAAGLMYGGMRLYRRRFGQLESQEQLTTLGLGG